MTGLLIIMSQKSHNKNFPDILTISKFHPKYFWLFCRASHFLGELFFVPVSLKSFQGLADFFSTGWHGNKFYWNMFSVECFKFWIFSKSDLGICDLPATTECVCTSKNRKIIVKNISFVKTCEKSSLTYKVSEFIENTLCPICIDSKSNERYARAHNFGSLVNSFYVKRHLFI